MKIVFLDAATLGDISFESIANLGDFVQYDYTSEEQVVSRIKEADIVITNKVKLNESNLEGANKLKLICIAATGMDNVDLDLCTRKNIIVKNVSGYSTDSVVQLTFAYTFYFLQDLKYYRDYTSEKKWQESFSFSHFKNFDELKTMKIGIIGLGNIGEKVANIFTSFGCQVFYYSTSGKNKNSNYTTLNLADLLATCNIISIHAPLNDQTKNLISAKELNLLKSGSFLFNLGRGGIINEEDLASFIKEHPSKLKVGIDVLSTEPISSNHPFNKILNNPNVLITPHIGWASQQARTALLMGIKENIVKFIG